MDPVAMVGVWAGAILAAAGVGRLAVTVFTKAVRATVGDEFRKVWRELADQDEWFHSELREVKQAVQDVSEQFRPNGGTTLRDSVDRLEKMMQAHIQNEQ